MSENKLNDNDFGQILGKIVLSRIEQAEKGFKSTVELVKKNVAKSKDDQSYDFSEALEHCKNYAEIYDAADYLHKYIFNRSKKSGKTYMYIRKHIKFNTINSSEWGKNGKYFEQYIKDILKEEKNDLIYIFWSSRPVKYFYVGITRRGTERLRLHLKAFASAGEADKLTIIHLNKILLERVEACIIRILGIERKGEKFGIGKETLKYNKSYGISFEGELHKDYKKLRTLLEKFNKLIKDYHKKPSKQEELRGKLQDLKIQISKI